MKHKPDSQIHVSPKGQPASFAKRQDDQRRQASINQQRSNEQLARAIQRLRKPVKTGVLLMW